MLLNNIIRWVAEVIIVYFGWVRVAPSATIKVKENTVPPF